MNTFDIPFPALGVNPADIYKLIGGSGSRVAPEVEDVTEKIFGQISGCTAHCGFKTVDGKVSGKDEIDAGGVKIRTGRLITSYLRNSEFFLVYVATAGSQFSEYQQSGRDILWEYIVDCIGSEIAEAAAGYLSRRMEEILTGSSLKISNMYSPGYCEWDVREQEKIFSLLPDRPCGIELTPSFLMQPVKSISGIAGVGRAVTKKPYGCDICKMKNCYKNRKNLK